MSESTDRARIKRKERIEYTRNWAGNYEYSTRNIYFPQTVEEVQALVKGHAKMKALGTRHSFNGIADSGECLISLKHLNQVLALEPNRGTVTVEAGIRYGELSDYLHREGFALHNLASLPHISVAGACATATHGSGDKNGNLATAVSALELVTADGQIRHLSRQQAGERFAGTVVGLGGMGIVTKLTLDILPTFEICQHVYQNLPLSEVEAHFDEIMSSAYSVSLFTDWQNERFNQVWLKRRVTNEHACLSEADFFGATLQSKPLHPITALSAEPCTTQLGIPGPWHERLPHFRMAFTPSSGDELQSEYFIPRQEAIPALLRLNQLGGQIAPLLLISEIRTIAQDELWMSPCYKQPSVAIHFTWQPDWAGVKKLLPVIEEELAPFNARPHWGKLFTMSPTRLQSLYEKLPDFQKLLQNYDPDGKFRNAFLKTYL